MKAREGQQDCGRIITERPVTELKCYGTSTFYLADGRVIKVKHEYGSPEDEARDEQDRKE